MPWLLSEDAAVKAKFEALSVTNGNAPSGLLPVTVRFRMPQEELGDTKYPMIIIERNDVTKADDREHRGPTGLPYIPQEFDLVTLNVPDRDNPGQVKEWDPVAEPDASPLRVPDHPVPFNLDYTVTVHTRMQSQLTELVGKLAAIDRIPHRFGYLEIPEDGTTRTLDVLGGPECLSAPDGDGKRTFQAVYSIRVVSELSLYDVSQALHFVGDTNVEVIPLPTNAG